MMTKLLIALIATAPLATLGCDRNRSSNATTTPVASQPATTPSQSAMGPQNDQFGDDTIRSNQDPTLNDANDADIEPQTDSATDLERPSQPTETRPTASPVPADTEENRTGQSRQN